MCHEEVKEIPSKRSRKRACAATIVFIVVLVSFWAWVNHSAHRAESALGAITLATLLLEAHVREYQEWPSSWNDLARINVESEGPYFWPRDETIVRSLVEIDFNRSVAELSLDKASVLDAVQPKVATYDSYRQGLDQLFLAVKQAALTARRSQE